MSCATFSHSRYRRLVRVLMRWCMGLPGTIDLRGANLSIHTRAQRSLAALVIASVTPCEPDSSRWSNGPIRNRDAACMLSRYIATVG